MFFIISFPITLQCILQFEDVIARVCVRKVLPHQNRTVFEAYIQKYQATYRIHTSNSWRLNVVLPLSNILAVYATKEVILHISIIYHSSAAKSLQLCFYRFVTRKIIGNRNNQFTEMSIFLIRFCWSNAPLSLVAVFTSFISIKIELSIGGICFHALAKCCFSSLP